MSGLALACHLDERNAQGDKCVRNGVVLEPRTDYQRDKTWCYWQQQPGLFDQAITHSWSSWEVRSAGRRWVSTCAQTPYVRVDSGRYYELAAAKLAQSNTLALNLNVGAQTIARLDDCFKVETTQGDLLARRVVDTRPRAIPEGTLLQHFYGWEIETERDVFDPSTVTLMDFGAGSADNIHFYYVLPFSPRSALVETTHFSKKTGSVDQYETELRHYLNIATDLLVGRSSTPNKVYCQWQNGGKSVPSAQIVTPFRWACTGVQLSRLPDIVFLTLKTKRRSWPFG